MPTLDLLIPTPRLLETDHVDVAARPEQVWQRLRHDDLARSPLVHALFELRALPSRLAGKHEPSSVRIDDLRSTPDRPGFQLLVEQAPETFAVGAIGKVWHGEIPFVHVNDARAFEAFSEPDFVKVAWSIRIRPFGEQDCRVELEVRVDATDDQAWAKFERYFRLIGVGSRFIRRSLLSDLARELGTPDAGEQTRPLPGDELLDDAAAATTDGITIAATPEQIWPHLSHMALSGPACGDAALELLCDEPPYALVFGGLYDAATGQQLPFAAPRPESYWHTTCALVLEKLDEGTTRLHVRGRAAFSKEGCRRAAWLRAVHPFILRRTLKQLAARVEGRLPRDDLKDVLSGVGGAGLMLASLLTPFLRRTRSHWGLDEATAREPRPGDELVSSPVWSWTHGVEIDAPPERVWRWVAQIGADKAGFYSYQWLENLVGCGIHNADSVHQDWELEQGDTLLLHPKVPPLRIVQLERGHHFVAFAPIDEQARAKGEPWATASWLFAVEPLPEGRSRLLTRYRVACSPDVATWLAFGPTLLEPIGFAMDRRMLLNVKQRVERERRYELAALCGKASSSIAASSSATLAGLVK
jgi:hypothetical protein